MRKIRKQTQLRLATRGRLALILLEGCLLCGGTSWSLAQTVSVSVWPSQMDHSLQAVLVFQSQSREEPETQIKVYDDILAQQVTHIDLAAPPTATADGRPVEALPSIDQEADSMIVDPLNSGAQAINSTPKSIMDFLLITQLSRAVKPSAYRVASGVTGSADLEALAFLNPDGTHVLFTVNHSRSPVSFEGLWKDRIFTYTQAGSSIGLFAWDPKSPLVSLVPRQTPISAEGLLSIRAECSNVSPLGIDLQCESQGDCSIFPARFTCNPQQKRTMLTVAVCSTGKDDPVNPLFVTITAIPDAGEPTSLRVPCRNGEQ